VQDDWEEDANETFPGADVARKTNRALRIKVGSWINSSLSSPSRFGSAFAGTRYGKGCTTGAGCEAIKAPAVASMAAEFAAATSGMNDGMQQQIHCIYENMALLTLDLFACIVAMRIDAGPPFRRSSRSGYR
jgi:hypothetical protein